MYYNNTNVIVCPQAVYSTVSGNLFFFIQTNKYNYTLKDIAIFLNNYLLLNFIM